jgi:hypothetical protein
MPPRDQQSLADSLGEQGDDPLLPTLQDLQRQQQAAFTKDAFATGTGLYPEVGEPAATLEERERQAHMIAARSGQPTLPLSQPEIAGLAPELAKQGPLADGYAWALSTYAAKHPRLDAWPTA